MLGLQKKEVIMQTSLVLVQTPFIADTRSPMERHLDQLVVGTPDLQDTVQKVKDFILHGNDHWQWIPWLVGRDRQTLAREALQKWGNGEAGVQEFETILQPSWFMHYPKVREAHAELTQLIDKFLQAMRELHEKKSEVGNNFWNENVNLITDACRILSGEYIKIYPALICHK